MSILAMNWLMRTGSWSFRKTVIQARLGNPVSANRPQGVIFGSPDHNIGPRGGSDPGVQSTTESGFAGPRTGITAGNTSPAGGSQSRDGIPAALRPANSGSQKAPG